MEENASGERKRGSSVPTAVTAPEAPPFISTTKVSFCLALLIADANVLALASHF